MEEKWKMVCEFAKMRHPVCDVNEKKKKIGKWKEKMTSFSEEIFERHAEHCASDMSVHVS